MKAEPDKIDRVLQPSKDRYRLLAGNISDVVFTLDLNLRCTYCSPSVERLRGFTAAEAMSQTLEQMLTPASWRLSRAALEEGLAALSLAMAVPGNLPELLGEELRVALRSVGRITGRVDLEALLDVVFRDFCIGK